MVFDGEYDPSRLVRVQPAGRGFSLWAPPRLRDIYAGDFEPLTTDLVGALARRCDVLLDIGAHVGFHSLAAAVRHPGLDVVAVEPVPANADILRRNLAENGVGRATVVDAAVAAREGTAPLWISRASDNCGFVPHPAAPPQNRIDVGTTTLAALLKGVEDRRVLVKMDIEGAEMEVLTAPSSARLFDRPNARLIFELNPRMLAAAGADPDDLLRWLADRGCRLFLIDDRNRRYLNLASPGDWRSRMPERGSVNVLAVRDPRIRHYVLFCHSAGWAGAERSALDVVRELTETGEALFTAVLPGAGPLEAALREAGAGTIGASYGWWLSDLPRADAEAGLENSLETVFGNLALHLLDMQPDLLISLTMTVPWGACLADCMGRPHAWHVHELEPPGDWIPPGAAGSFLDWIRDGADLLVLGSPTIRDRLFADLPPERWTLLPRRFHPPAKDPGAPRRFRRSDAFKILSAGTVHPTKGHDAVVRAAGRLAASGRDVELVIAGPVVSDAFAEELMRLAAATGAGDRVTLAGPVDPIGPLMEEADVAVCAGRGEAFGRVPFEMALAGRPSVLARSGHYETLLAARPELALGFAPGDDAELAAALERLVSDPALRAGLADAARRYTGDRYTGDTAAAAMAAFAERLRDTADRGRGRSRMPDGLRPLWMRAIAAWQANGRKWSDARAEADRLNAELAACRACIENLERELQMRWWPRLVRFARRSIGR